MAYVDLFWFHHPCPMRTEKDCRQISMKPKPIAVLCSDLHLSLQAPACRADKNWLDVQAFYLGQLKKVANGLPVLCAGDIFDRWNASPELINFALERLPDNMYCVPGQHDLPNHSMDQIHRSGYGVLINAGKIKQLHPNISPEAWNSMHVYGFGWGQKITPVHKREDWGHKIPVHVAVIHKFIWINEETKYPGAGEDSQLKSFAKQLKGYDAVVIGDNHKGWVRLPSLTKDESFKSQSYLPKTDVINCGTFIRRKSDEEDYHPAIGILFDDGTIERRYCLDTSIDKFHANAKVREAIAVNMAQFINQLENLGEHGLNFEEAVRNHLRGEEFDDETKKIILQALEAR